MKMPAKIKSALKQINAIIYIQNKYLKLLKWKSISYIKLLYTLSPVLYEKHRYKIIFGKKINLKNPQTYNEKLVWLNLYWMHPLKVQCADKYTMRTYVEEHGWGHILPILLGVYEKSSEINFDLLPEKFVLKCTHGCGFNIICDNKSELDIAETRRKLDKWMTMDYSKFAGEFHYSLMKPRIICEQFLEEIAGKLPVDYKVYCFNGKAYCTLVALDRNMCGKTNVYDFYSLDWKSKLPYTISSNMPGKFTSKPDAYDEIIEAAEALSKDIPFVRMDFYSIKGKAMIGEMTFTPAGCMSRILNDEAQKVLGEMIKLPQAIPYRRYFN
jgi:hypothetical protein